MDIHLNGERRAIAAGATVAMLLKDLNLRTDHVAVEVNLQILDRKEFDNHVLRDGDRVEVISFIGGGSDRCR